MIQSASKLLEKINHYSFFIGFLLIFLYNSPYLILKENAIFNIGDNLDGVVAMLKLLSDSAFYLSFDNNIFIESYLGGSIPRNALMGSFNIITILFYFFEINLAYVLSQYVVLFIGFIGMYLFSTNYIFKDQKGNFFCMLISFAFAIIPQKPIYGGAIYTIAPFFFYAFLNLIYNKKVAFNFFLLFILPFFTSLAMNTIFIFFYLAILLCYFHFIKKYNVFYGFIGLLCLFLSMILADIQLFILYFFDDIFISHRSVRVPMSLSLESLFYEIWRHIFYEKYNNFSIMQHFTFSVLILMLPLLIYFKNQTLKVILILIGMILVNNIFSNILFWNFLDFFKINYSFFRMFDFTRFTSLNPFLWWSLFAILMKLAYNILVDQFSRLSSNFVIVCICIMSIIYVVKNSWLYRANLNNFLTNNYNQNYDSNCISINQFYSSRLFNEIRDYIGLNQAEYKVGSIGLHPAIASFNGFYSIDGYANIYSLKYKNKFREIIKNELEKSPKQLAKFDFWGNRCYLFSSELLSVWNHKDHIIASDNKILIHNLDYNFKKLSEIGCKYIFSSVRIDTIKNSALVFEKRFEHSNSPYSIYLYSLNFNGV